MEYFEESNRKNKEPLEISPKKQPRISSFDQIKTYEELDENLKGNMNPSFAEKEVTKKEETVLPMDGKLVKSVRNSHIHIGTFMVKSFEKKLKVNRERNIMFSDSIGGNVFKDYEKRTESELSQQEDDIELEYLGI